MMDTVRGAAGVGEPFREIVDAEVVEDYQPRHLNPRERRGQCYPDCTTDCGTCKGYQGRHRRD